MKEDTIVHLFRKRGRGWQLFCILQKADGKFYYKIKEKGKWKSLEGFPEKNIIKQVKLVKFYKKLLVKENTEESIDVDVRSEKDFLRPFG